LFSARRATKRAANIIVLGDGSDPFPAAAAKLWQAVSIAWSGAPLPSRVGGSQLEQPQKGS